MFRRGRPIEVFGAALDVLPHAEKINLKRAYLAARIAGRLGCDDPADPYDALRRPLEHSPLAARLRFEGKFPIPSPWRPKPAPVDTAQVSVESARRFWASSACGDLAERLKHFVAARYQDATLPLMIGVDHGLTGGVVAAVAEAIAPATLGMVVLDGHLDAITAAARCAALDAADGASEPVGVAAPGEPFSCQNFLSHLIAAGRIRPENLIVAGVYAAPGAELVEHFGTGAAGYLREVEQLRAAGVQLLSRDDLRAQPRRFSAALARLDVDQLYVSLDLDVCASRRVPAVRFHDSIGLDPEELWHLARQLAEFLDTRGVPLAAVDIMELDVHLIDLEPRSATENETVDAVVGFLEALLA